MQWELAKMDFVVVAKVGCADQESPTLSHELRKLWHRANKTCKTQSSHL